MADITPMMQQYLEVKKEYPDTILLFRLGDFYEMFFDDAKTVSRELDLVLTGRACGNNEKAPMCGVPFHSADSYIARLVQKGYKVAICEQLEDPALAKGLVKRDVTRVVTPGTVIENSMLDESKNNYLACICTDDNAAGICFVDVSTGTLNLTRVDGKDFQTKVINELARFSPSEIILSKTCAQTQELICSYISKKNDVSCEVFEDSEFSFDKCLLTAERHFGKEKLASINCCENKLPVCSMGVCLAYLSEMQKNDLDNIRDIDLYNETQYLKIDYSSRRNLEITETMRSREKKGSLLWVLDKTSTSMGRRLLRSWLERPLVSIARIIKRHNAVDELCSNRIACDEITAQLKGVYDIERLMTRVLYKTANARELNALKMTAAVLPSLRSTLSQFKSGLLTDALRSSDELSDIYSLISDSITEEPPFSIREGGIIKDGYNKELDSLRDIENNAMDYILRIEAAEQEKTGIKKLKIGYNRVFGYYIEVPNASKDMVPESYIRKQTLSNCERYITQELKELESKVLGAKERIVRLEYEIFCGIRDKVAAEYGRIMATAHAVSLLDVLCSFAYTAIENNYVRPEMTQEPVIDIKDGRHAVVERMLDTVPFVPNDTLLDCGENRCAIITGPNMAGKSTYMRQVAVICLMAQIGSFVPAKSARLGVCDAIFTRVGASDDLASGQSTFMVEMSEVASILNNATANSLIILDEIGRGTSTFDGMSIARAVLEFTADKKRIGAKTLFATHYHELTELEQQLEGVKNYNISVKKRGDNITFLRRIVRGGADGSYGIEVAKLAGVPNAVVNRARVILKAIEGDETVKKADMAKVDFDDSGEELQMSITSSKEDEIIAKLRDTDAETLTPIEALTFLYQIINELKK
ncbi:MAG: DNA mismatch repair protein MutS [Clostridia bacterium]|nr:DNA mismatch repair protein MutS [Clostridia bacterium]